MTLYVRCALFPGYRPFAGVLTPKDLEFDRDLFAVSNDDALTTDPQVRATQLRCVSLRVAWRQRAITTFGFALHSTCYSWSWRFLRCKTPVYLWHLPRTIRYRQVRHQLPLESCFGFV